ncbi:MAG TPA: aminomethyl-transferring glycine dehydrogenase subunit GcvPA [bacterium]|nr:aminomethyl-transferring glycine dehydrogenase subunit GcvPA [bacterium]
MPYTPHTEDDVKEMLRRIGAERLEDLWKAVPERIRLKRPLDLPPSLGEAELMRAVKKLAAENTDAGRAACFLGGGTYHHYIPPAIDQLISRAEFYTAYTPYQPEISQGTLQAIFEFQTMVCELTGMGTANASMYDGAEATAEAVLMAERLRPKNQAGAVVLAGALNPLYRMTVNTYLKHCGRPLVTADHDLTGALDLAALKKTATGALCVVVQHPNYFGCLENMEDVAAVCHEAGALLIVVVTEALSLAMLEPPGSFGAAIVAGEGQSLGIPMGYGGPHLGLFACREDDVRKMPGRLAGETVDADGRRGFVLTLATREQHIRRAKATSNICTNQGLLALAATIYLSLMGPRGLAQTAAVNRGRSEYLKQKLQEQGAGRPVFSAPTFNEFALDIGRPPGPVLRAMRQRGWLAGIPLGRDYPALKNAVLITVTEMLARDDLDAYARVLADLLSGNECGQGTDYEW